MKKKRYRSSLTEGEWKHIKWLLPKAKPGGRPRTTKLREVLDAIFYLVRGGLTWEMLPHEFPKWKTVYHYFRTWRLAGVWQRIHNRLRARVRQAAGRHAQPSAGIIDSQSVKTTEVGGAQRGYDHVKNVNGRKRHVVVDTLGLLIVVVVHAAARTDREGAKLVLQKLAHAYTRLTLLWADQGYTGAPLAQWVRALRTARRLRLEIVQRQAGQKGFVVLPRRWVVERTFGWIGRYRRLSKDYERLPETSETMIYIAMTRLMLQRLDAA
jgi:putative transposase